MFRHIITNLDAKYNELVIGEDIVLANETSDILQSSAYREDGYFIQKVLNIDSINVLRKVLNKYIKDKILTISSIDLSGFDLENYHNYVNEEMHRKVAKWSIEIEDIIKIEKTIRESISNHLKVNLRQRKINVDGEYKEVIGFRIVRPNKGDENPYHKDGWMEQWESTLNVWIPISGCTELNSLNIISKNHLWNESKLCRTMNGAYYNGKKFRVSAAVSTDYDINIIKPFPKYGEALIFSPYIIHGNAQNLENNLTRVSLEIRYEKVD